MGRMCVSSCKCWVLVTGVHPVAILSAVFCVICGLLMFVVDASGNHIDCTKRIQPARGWCATVPQSGGTLCKLYPPTPPLWRPGRPVFGEASRASPQHGWRSAYSLRETLSPTQDQNQH